MNEPIVVNQSLKGTILYAFGSLVLSLLCLMSVFVNFRSNQGILKVTQDTIIYFSLKVILAFGFIFFGYGFFFFVKKAKSKKEILIVDEKGITDNSTSLALGFIPWKDIEDIYIDSVMGNQFIEIVLNNEEYYIQKLRGIKKQAVLVNKKMGHQVVCITLNSSGISPEALLPKIQEMFELSKLS